jgi:hypothetical protein
MAFDLSTKSLKTVQQIEKLYNKSTANPQKIEQVEFELNRLKEQEELLTLKYCTEPTESQSSEGQQSEYKSWALTTSLIQLQTKTLSSSVASASCDLSIVLFDSSVHSLTCLVLEVQSS